MSSAPPRRSKRITTAKTKDDAKPKAKAPPAKKRASQGADTEDTRELPPQRKAQKRAKTSATVKSSDQPARRGRGKLSQLTEIPLDVLYEIFSYLEPPDLLRMSRMTKTLRTMLMSKKTAFVWEHARLGTEGLPPMIEGLTEPQYANLLFDSHCHNCLKTPTKYIQWRIRMRLCKECLDKGTIMATRQQLHSHGHTDSFKSREILAVTPHFKYSSKAVHISCYDIRTYEMLVEESRPLQYGLPQYSAWLAKKQKEYKALVMSCKQYQSWAASRAETRATELDSLRRGRLESIIARLTADGWDEEVKLQSTLETLQGHPLVKQPKELTDRIWVSIKPTLTELVSKLHADRLEQKIQRAVSERTRTLERLGHAFFATLPETPHHPPPSALCAYQPFSDIIRKTPPDEDATTKLNEAFDPETVSTISAEWREEQEKHLTALLSQRKGRSADLALVVNAFACGASECGVPAAVLHYPHFASHSCFYAVEDANAIETLDEDAYARCQGFVRTCGLDPDSATPGDMDAADLFFRCEACEEPMYGMKALRLMRWRTAMNHHHSQVSRVEDAEIVALGRKQERVLLEEDLAARLGDRQAFVCVHCDVAETSRAARAEHLRSVHGIRGEPKAVDHYRRSLKYKGVNELEVEVRQALVCQDEDVESQ